MYPDKTNPASGIFVHEQIEQLKNLHKCDVLVVSPRPYSPRILGIFNKKWSDYSKIPDSDTIDGISVHYPRYLRPPGQIFHAISCYFMYLCLKRHLKDIVRDFKPDIIHSNTATPDGFAAARISKQLNIPSVCTFHGSDINIYPYYGLLSMAITKYVISTTDQILTVSNDLKVKSERLAKPKRKIKVLYNGCDAQKFKFNADQRSSKRKQLGIPENGRVIVFVGSLLKAKGIFELLEGFFVLAEKHKDLHLIILGKGPEFNNIKAQAFRLKSVDMIHLTGQIEHDDVPAYLSASDIFILPSYREGLPVSIIEAMACSLPVIATNVGGIPEIVKNNESGIIIDAKDVKSLVGAIELLLCNKDLLKQFGRAARAIIEKDFALESSANNLFIVYSDILKL
jgi:glycosyltransferase involved in cell wall biosynthesis